jgi:alcohol dehydrogenase class IV
MGASMPVIALPSTAGTGAEVSRGAIILHRSARRKRGVRGRGIAPRVAVVDPELVISAGQRVTAESGFDAMAHALETGVSRAASPLNLLLAGESLRRLFKAIPDAIADPESVAARSSGAYAALLMGINLATASTCLPHRLQYPVGALTGTSHARGVAALLPRWLRRTEQYAADRLAALARGAGFPGGDQAKLVKALLAAVDDWIDRIGMRTTLGALGVNPGDVRELVAMVEGSLHNDPGPVEPADLEKLYRESL